MVCMLGQNKIWIEPDYCWPPLALLSAGPRNISPLFPLNSHSSCSCSFWRRASFLFSNTLCENLTVNDLSGTLEKHTTAFLRTKIMESGSFLRLSHRNHQFKAAGRDSGERSVIGVWWRGNETQPFSRIIISNTHSLVRRRPFSCHRVRGHYFKEACLLFNIQV